MDSEINEKIEALKSEIKDIDVTVKRANKTNPKLVIAIVAIALVLVHVLFIAILCVIYSQGISTIISFGIVAALIGIIVYLAMWYRKNIALVYELNNKRDKLRAEMLELQESLKE